MRKRIGRVLALILAMSLIMANVCAASATDSQAGVAESTVQENVSEGNLEEGTEVLPEDTETAETTEKQEDTETAEQPEKSEAEGSEEQSKPVAEEQNTAKEETSAAEENTVAEAVKELRYENEEVTVVVSEKEAGAISEGTSLKVVPITENDDATKAQYQEVEKQIQEKAGKEEKEVAGFLAYDITLVDAQGNEVEPNSSVKVSMEYKKETIPEGLSEEKAKEADVTVYHLEEDENGEVKDVVDMGEAKQVENISATDKNEVKKLEVQTESFSSFAIIWSYVYRVNVKYVDTQGRSINSDEFQSKNVNMSSGREVDLNEYALDSVKIEGVTYKHKENRVGNLTGDKVTKVKYSRTEGYQYYSSERWRTWGDKEKTVYLIYEKQEPVEELKTVPTVDSSAAGITMKMVNLKGDNGANIGPSDKEQINFGGNSGYGNGNIKYNLLERKIGNDGYPRTTNKVNNRTQSLSKLFKNAKEVNHLFLQKTYETTKYYEYSSFENYAYLGDGNEFTVYEQLGTPRMDAKDKQFFFQRGNFMPYNRIEAGKFSNLRNLYDEDGRLLPKTDPRYNEKLYVTQGTDYQFGMEIEAEFLQPRDGKVTYGNTTEDMVYEFNGDDDLWVFVDGVLVLDIGGIHDAHSGKIDFATGDITWWDWEATGEKIPAEKNGTIKEMFWQARRFPDGSAWNDERDERVEEFFEENTFKDYSEHKFQMFYLERGGGASNLHVKFNLPTVPKNTVNVEKIVKDKNGDDVNYAEDIDFKFQIELDKAVYANKAYKLFEDGVEIKGDWKTDENGQFTLKHNQKAQFPEMAETSMYRVKELGAYLDGYEVKIDGTTVEVKDEDGESGEKIPTVDSGEQNVGNNSTVVFENIVDKTATLRVNKKLAEGTDIDPNKEFAMQLKLKDQLYKGSYTIGKTTYKVEDGIIRLKAGETAKITGLPYGVVFDIQEFVDGTYIPISYEVTGEAGNIKLPIRDENGKITNDIYSASAQMNGDCQVTVTNKKLDIRPEMTSVEVTKTWENMGTYDLPEYVEVTLYEDVNDNGVWDEGDRLIPEYETKRLTKENSWTAKWWNLPADTNYVVKETYPEGYELIETEIDNTWENITQIGDRHDPNNITEFNIGSSNMLLVKKTSNAFLLWTPTNLNLDQGDITQIVEAINKNGLAGGGNLNPNNVTYGYGNSSQDGVTVERNGDGWRLKFAEKSAWAKFWQLSYSRTQIIKLKNYLSKDAKIEIKVDKKWVGGQENSITIQLYQNGSEYRDSVIITENEHWTYTFSELPAFTANADGTFTKNVYMVKEIKVGDKTVDQNTGKAGDYQSEISDLENGVITITNTKGKPWEIYKVSSSKTEGKKLYLKDAWFELKSDSDTFYGKTDGNGLIKWYEDEGHVTEAKLAGVNGTFTLRETKAPLGYQVSKENWTIKLNYGNVESIVSSNGNEIKPEEIDGCYRYYYEDTPIYSLPESGGNGIYWYIVSGVLLLTAAGMLILYKNKRKEVLES